MQKLKRKNYQTFQYPLVLMLAADELDHLMVLLINLDEAGISRESDKSEEPPIRPGDVMVA